MMNNNTTEIPMVPKTKGKNKGDMKVRNDNGKLPADIPEPKFVADPNHRRKGLTGELIKLDMSKVSEKHTMTRMDSTRIGKNFGYMARTLKQRPEDEFEDAASAVLEHHFDCHNHCGDWCTCKSETEEERKKSIRYYRCKKRDAKLYAVLQEKLDKFVSKDRLTEMAHTLDTNMNEAFNQICTWFCPKNKVFAGSYSLHNRIAFAVGINSLGVLQYFKRLFRKLGITMTDNITHYLTIKEANRVKKHDAAKTTAAKKDKNKKKYDRLKVDTAKAKTELSKRAGTYQKGMNLDDPIDLLVNGHGADAAARAPATKRAKNNGHCEYCGVLGHLSKTNKLCVAVPNAPKKYRKVDGTLLTEPARVVDDFAFYDAMNDCNDCDNFDGMPLVPVPGDENSFDVDAAFNVLAFGLDAPLDSDDDDEEAAGIDRCI
jgi:hypothetical protein